jgi:hypothetical protein
VSYHRTRLIVNAVLWALSLVGVVVLSALELADSVGFGIVVGANTTLLAALTDAAMVERRRRDPRVRAIADDVRQRGEPAEPYAPAPASGDRGRRKSPLTVVRGDDERPPR